MYTFSTTASCSSETGAPFCDGPPGAPLYEACLTPCLPPLPPLLPPLSPPLSFPLPSPQGADKERKGPDGLSALEAAETDAIKALLK